MNTGAFKSLDGGKTFKRMPTFHGDNHSLWINPQQTNYMINANDGGGDVSRRRRRHLVDRDEPADRAILSCVGRQ